MIVATVIAACLQQDVFGQRMNAIGAELDPLPFETITTDSGNLKRLKEHLAKEGDLDFLSRGGQGEGTALYELVVHPRHTSAYQNLSSFVHWTMVEGKNGPIPVAVDIKDAMVKDNLLDGDKNTILNRVLLSHRFINERQAILVLDLLEKRKLMTDTSNRFGQTPMMLACEAGWSRVVDRLLTKRFSFSAKDSQHHDAVDYIRFSRPEVNLLAHARREAYTTEAIADLLNPRLDEVGKKRLFVAINDWLRNPYRLDCLTGLEDYVNMHWPTPKGPKPVKKIKIEYDMGSRTVVPPKKSDWDPRKGPPGWGGH